MHGVKISAPMLYRLEFGDANWVTRPAHIPLG